MAVSRTVRPSVLAFGIAISSFFINPTQSVAAKADVTAIANALVPGTPASNAANVIKAATPTQLKNAVVSLLQGKTAAKAAAIVGEALKYADDSDTADGFGAELAAAIQAKSNDPMYMGIFADKARFVGTAAKTAATGTSPFAEWVPGFANGLTATNDEAYAAAKIAIGSKTAAGAVVGGRTLDPTITTDAQRLALAQQALLATNGAVEGSPALTGKGLTAAALEVSKFISLQVDDPAKFATDLLNTSVVAKGKTSQALLSKINLIAPGVVAGAPQSASAVLEALFTNNGATGGEASVNPTTKKLEGSTIALVTIKNASKLAASIGLVADTEEYSFLATSFGKRIGTGVIKSSLTNGLAKALVSSMVKKPLPVGASTVLGQARDNAVNRADEAGEIAAYLLNAVVGNATADGGIDGLKVFEIAAGATDKQIKKAQKAAVTFVTGLIKSVVNAYNLKKSVFNPTVVAADVAGSVALTLKSLKDGGLIADPIFQALTDAFNSEATAKKINKTMASQVKDALLAGIAGNDGPTGQKYEDGTKPDWQVGPGPGGITEPETDIRGA